jgi:hypothetical protein
MEKSAHSGKHIYRVRIEMGARIGCAQDKKLSYAGKNGKIDKFGGKGNWRCRNADAGIVALLRSRRPAEI